jgi:tetratricopeptide (TPR) repeat protein
LQGICLGQLQRYEQALKCYDRAIALQPENAIAYYNKACCYAEQENLEGAIANLKTAFRLDKGDLKGTAKSNLSFSRILNKREFQDLF